MITASFDFSVDKEKLTIIINLPDLVIISDKVVFYILEHVSRDNITIRADAYIVFTEYEL